MVDADAAPEEGADAAQLGEGAILEPELGGATYYLILTWQPRPSYDSEKTSRWS